MCNADAGLRVYMLAAGRSILTLPEAFTHFKERQHKHKATFNLVYTEAATLRAQACAIF